MLAAADGGVLYVDEVNLLPDHLVDVLLDAAATGINRVEREGISHVHPSRFLLIGSMNPEEGELRPQLLDRFGLAVEIRTTADPGARAAAVRRRLAFDEDPGGVVAAAADDQAGLVRRLAGAVPARLPGDLVESVSALCVASGAEGLRADLTICRAAAALAGWEGRAWAGADDVRRVAPMALSHRARRDPLEPVGMDRRRLAEALDEHLGPREDPASGPDGSSERPGRPEGEDGPPEGRDGPPEELDQPGGGAAGGPSPGAHPHPGPDRGPGPSPGQTQASSPGSGASTPVPGGDADGESDGPGSGQDRPPAAPAAPAAGSAWLAPAAKSGRPGARDGAGLTAPASGRGRTVRPGGHGRVVGDRPPEGPLTSIAVGATIRAAARRTAGVEARHPDPGAGPLSTSLVAPDDVREAVRVERTARLIVLAVDASGSMGAPQRMEAAKGAVLELLTDAYQRRDLVGLVSFRGDRAAVLLRPTGSVEIARARLVDLPTGGRTPLAAGIAAALELATAPARSASHLPRLVVVTDGRATAGPPGRDPLDAAGSAADNVRRAGIDALVVDVEGTGGPLGRPRLGLARQLADRMGGRHVQLAGLDSDRLGRAIRDG